MPRFIPDVLHALVLFMTTVQIDSNFSFDMFSVDSFKRLCVTTTVKPDNLFWIKLDTLLLPLTFNFRTAVIHKNQQ